jgi:hypothetical protein
MNRSNRRYRRWELERWRIYPGETVEKIDNVFFQALPDTLFPLDFIFSPSCIQTDLSSDASFLPPEVSS